MRRVLLVHYHFLPVHNVAVRRLRGYARHLPAFGWTPSVLTREWTSIEEADAGWGLGWEPDLARAFPFEIHRVRPGKRLPVRAARPSDPWLERKARSAVHVIAGDYPDAFASWIRPAAARAIDLVRRGQIDVVATYCPPESNHLVGRRVARATGVPWIAMFGDLYGFFHDSSVPASLSARLGRANRRRWLRPALACTGVSPYMVEYLTRRYGKQTALVLLGYEPDELAATASLPRPPAPRFVISHVGSIYPGNQRPELFFDGLDALLRDRPDAAARIAVRFVGSRCDETLLAMMRGRPSAAVCTIVPRVDATAALAAVGESDVVLAFNCTAFRERHGTLSYPSKIFEALGAGRPILAIPPDGDWVDALLDRTHGGLTAATPGQIASRLASWFDQWRRDGRTASVADPSAVADYTMEQQVAQLARLLDRVVAARVPAPALAPERQLRDH